MKGETAPCLTGTEQISVDYSRKVAKCRGIAEPEGRSSLRRYSRVVSAPAGGSMDFDSHYSRPTTSRSSRPWPIGRRVEALPTVG